MHRAQDLLTQDGGQIFREKNKCAHMIAKGPDFSSRFIPFSPQKTVDGNRGDSTSWGRWAGRRISRHPGPPRAGPLSCLSQARHPWWPKAGGRSHMQEPWACVSPQNRSALTGVSITCAQCFVQKPWGHVSLGTQKDFRGHRVDISNTLAGSSEHTDVST